MDLLFAAGAAITDTWDLTVRRTLERQTAIIPVLFTGHINRITLSITSFNGPSMNTRDTGHPAVLATLAECQLFLRLSKCLPVHLKGILNQLILKLQDVEADVASGGVDELSAGLNPPELVTLLIQIDQRA